MQHRDRRIYGQTATPAQGDIAASRLLRLRDGRIVPIFMRLGIRSAISALVLTLQRIGPVWRAVTGCTRSVCFASEAISVPQTRLCDRT